MFKRSIKQVEKENTFSRPKLSPFNVKALTLIQVQDNFYRYILSFITVFKINTHK